MYFRFIRNKYYSVFSADIFKHDMHIKINTKSVNIVHFNCRFPKSLRNLGNTKENRQNLFINSPTNSITYSDKFALVQLLLQYLIQEETKKESEKSPGPVLRYTSALSTQGASLFLSLEQSPFTEPLSSVCSNAHCLDLQPHQCRFGWELLDISEKADCILLLGAQTLLE